METIQQLKCMVCGQPTMKMYCSSKCRQKAYRDRKRNPLSCVTVDEAFERMNWYAKHDPDVLSDVTPAEFLLLVFGLATSHKAVKEGENWVAKSNSMPL